MSFRRRRRPRVLALGFAAAALAASSAQAMVIPYLSGGSGISEGQLVQLYDYGPGTAHPDAGAGASVSSEPYDYGPGTAHPDYVASNELGK
jgi:hypothetical protein